MGERSRSVNGADTLEIDRANLNHSIDWGMIAQLWSGRLPGTGAMGRSVGRCRRLHEQLLCFSVWFIPQVALSCQHCIQLLLDVGLAIKPASQETCTEL